MKPLLPLAVVARATKFEVHMGYLQFPHLPAGHLLCRISFVLAATLALPSQAYAGPIFFPWYAMPFFVLREIGLIFLATSIIFAGIYKLWRKDVGQPMVKLVAKIFATIFVTVSLVAICRELYSEWRFNNPGADARH